MIFSEAQNIFAKILQPYSYNQFFDNIVGKRSLALQGENTAHRELLLGENPKKLLLDAYKKYASTLTCHIHTPSAPPPKAHSVDSSDEFLDLIQEYHQSGYTVRIPEITNISSPLSQLTRALELIVENRVGVVAFWSASGAAAPVHSDDVDVIVIQLVGTKRWFISDEPTTLPNEWKGIGEQPPSMGRYNTYDVNPGDLIYVPRGTVHTVQSTSESIHLSIGFVPVTVRDAISAILDCLSDLDRPLRSGLGTRADNLAQSQNTDDMLAQIKQGIDKLAHCSNSKEFFQESLAHRRAKLLVDLPKLPLDRYEPVTSANTSVRHHPLAISQLIKTPDIIDFRQPGEQTLIHLGVEECMNFIVTTPIFNIADIPGDVGDDIRIALVNKLLANGFLQLA